MSMNQTPVYCLSCRWKTFRVYRDEEELFGNCKYCGTKLIRIPLAGIMKDLKLKKIRKEMELG